MNQTNTYIKVRRLVVEATQVLGTRRVALCAGCSTSTVNGWLLREKAQLRPRTLQRTLPRLENWRDWVPGYRAGLQEFILLNQPDIQWHAACGELQDRLEEASESLTPDQLALGCEVHTHRIMEWRLGIFRPHHKEQVLLALGHLRHVDLWSVPADRTTSEKRAASLA